MSSVPDSQVLKAGEELSSRKLSARGYCRRVINRMVKLGILEVLEKKAVNVRYFRVVKDVESSDAVMAIGTSPATQVVVPPPAAGAGDPVVGDFLSDVFIVLGDLVHQIQADQVKVEFGATKAIESAWGRLDGDVSEALARTPVHMEPRDAPGEESPVEERVAWCQSTSRELLECVSKFDESQFRAVRALISNVLEDLKVFGGADESNNTTEEDVPDGEQR